METLAASAMASSETVSSHPDWSNLLGEILTFIAKRLSALDYASFSAVCTSWSSIALPENDMPCPLRKSQPYLLFPGDDADNCERSDFCTLFNFQDNSFIKIHPLPEIHDKWIVGSQFGWSTVIDELGNPNLLNPFNRSHIEKEGKKLKSHVADAHPTLKVPCNGGFGCVNSYATKRKMERHKALYEHKNECFSILFDHWIEESNFSK